MADQLSADIVVIGSGICGCLAAHRLAQEGASVLILEAGPRLDRGRIAAPIGSQERQLKEKGFAAQSVTTLRPGMAWKCFTLSVATSKPI